MDQDGREVKVRDGLQGEPDAGEQLKRLDEDPPGARLLVSAGSRFLPGQVHDLLRLDLAVLQKKLRGSSRNIFRETAIVLKCEVTAWDLSCRPY